MSKEQTFTYTGPLPTDREDDSITVTIIEEGLGWTVLDEKRFRIGEVFAVRTPGTKAEGWCAVVDGRHAVTVADRDSAIQHVIESELGVDRESLRLDYLAEIAEIHGEHLARATRLDGIVAAAVKCGATWSEIGRAAGITKQAANRRWSRTATSTN